MFGIKTSTGLHLNSELHRNKKFTGEQIACQFKKVCSRFLLGLNQQLDSRKLCLCQVILLVKDFFYFIFWIVKKTLSLQECKLYLKSRDRFFLEKISYKDPGYSHMSLPWHLSKPVSHFLNTKSVLVLEMLSTLLE